MRSAWFLDFCRTLRNDYVPLTIRQLHAELDDLATGVHNDVLSVLKRAGHVTLCFDSWTDAHGLPILGWAVRPAQQPLFLYRLEHVKDSQTSSFLSQRIDSTVEELEGLGVRVVGVLSDGAANCQKALQESRSKCLPTWCYAHLLSLLLKDLMKIFEGQFEQAKEISLFFRNRHQPHIHYNDCMAFFQGSTQLSKFCETRWGSAFA